MYNEKTLLDSLLDDVLAGTCSTPVYNYAPSVDVTETDAAYILDMDLPGRSQDDVNIELDRNVLTISSKIDAKAEKKEMKEEKKTKFLIRERGSYNFKRSFTLPEDVDQESISASFKNGVLTITMNKKAVQEPKKILIQAA